jgi:hypothetical protein
MGRWPIEIVGRYENSRDAMLSEIKEVPVQKVAARSASSALAGPAFGASLAFNAEAASKYFKEVEARLKAQTANLKANLTLIDRARGERFMALATAAAAGGLSDWEVELRGPAPLDLFLIGVLPPCRSSPSPLDR